MRRCFLTLNFNLIYIFFDSVFSFCSIYPVTVPRRHINQSVPSDMFIIFARLKRYSLVLMPVVLHDRVELVFGRLEICFVLLVSVPKGRVGYYFWLVAIL